MVVVGRTLSSRNRQVRSLKTGSESRLAAARVARGQRLASPTTSVILASPVAGKSTGGEIAESSVDGRTFGEPREVDVKGLSGTQIVYGSFDAAHAMGVQRIDGSREHEPAQVRCVT